LAMDESWLSAPGMPAVGEAACSWASSKPPGWSIFGTENWFAFRRLPTGARPSRPPGFRS